MFKNIFKAAKNLVKSPIGQIGIGILAPQLAASSGIAWRYRNFSG